ncbi:MAG: HAMP domain-containing histidine kinase, partial [Clostridia bacterium]|nr:HAMP domain-containing histidine kinase [Clostridia bacterium]
LRKIFLNYFTICASIILAVLILMGCLCSTVLANQVIHETALNLESAAGKIAVTYSEMPKNGFFVGGRVLQNAMAVVKDSLDAEVIILTDTELIAATTLETRVSTAEELGLPTEAVEQVLNGENYRRSGVFVKLQRPYRTAFTVGCPVMVGDNQIGGAVFVTTTEMSLMDTLMPFLMLYLSFIGLAIAIAFVIIYFVSLRMFRPLTQMSRAAKRYAQGDFSMRIDVRKNDELGELGMAFNNMADSLSRLEEMRQNFVEDVSHELRTPMTTIGGFIDGILDGVIEEKDQERYLQIVSDEIKRLSRMVSSMLDVAKIQAGTMAYNKVNFDLLSMVCQTLENYEERINEKQVRLSIDAAQGEDWYVFADRDSVYRVVYNLLDNAVKFVNDGGEITLRLQRCEEQIFAFVRNTGAGIPQKDVGQIFERFYKTDKSRSENRHGVGIGLYLVKTIVNDMGGDIYVSSKEGEFAEFAFSLPMAEKI